MLKTIPFGHKSPPSFQGPILEQNYQDLSVLLPRKVNQAFVHEDVKSTCFPCFVRLSSLVQVLPGIVIFQTGTHRNMH